MVFPINSLTTKDIAQATSCPAKLYWRYLGVLKGTRPYKRTVSPNELGKKGEQDISSMNIPVNELARNHFSNYDSMSGKTVELITPKTKIQAEELLKEIYKSMVDNISIINSINHKPINVDYEISKIGIQVKEKYDLSVVIPKVSIYNPVYHYRGIPDFIGLRKDGSTIIIDSKNTERATNYDEVQMNLYLDSFNKRYLTPSNEQELPKVADAILYQEKGEVYLKHLIGIEKNYRILSEIYSWKQVAMEHLEKMMSGELESFENLSEFEYGKKIENLATKHRQIRDDINAKLFDLREEQVKELEDIIVHQEPEYGVIFNTRHTEKTKEITEVEIDLPEIVKSAWKIKKNLLTDGTEFVINRESCNACSYKRICDISFNIIEPEDIKEPAIPTLIHKAFRSYERNEKKEIMNIQSLKEINTSIKKEPEKYIPSKYLKDFNNETLQEIINANKQLSRYALAKKFKKIDKEFRFWDI